MKTAAAMLQLQRFPQLQCLQHVLGRARVCLSVCVCLRAMLVRRDLKGREDRFVALPQLGYLRDARIPVRRSLPPRSVRCALGRWRSDE